MKRFFSIGMALLCFGLCSTAAVAQQGKVAPQSTPRESTHGIEISAPEEAKLSNQYKEAILKHMEQGKTVSVPADKIGYLKGAVRLIPHKHTQPVAAIVKAASDDKCYDSCQTLCNVSCHETCTWDCRIVNSEKVCDESCKTICPEVCNVTCSRVCP